MASNRVVIGNSPPQTKLTSIFTIKMPNALPTRNSIPIIPFAANNHLIVRSVLLLKIGVPAKRESPIKPYPKAAKVQKKECGLGAANIHTPGNSLLRIP